MFYLRFERVEGGELGFGGEGGAFQGCEEVSRELVHPVRDVRRERGMDEVGLMMSQYGG